MPIGRRRQDFYLLLTNQPGKDSWPITGATFILMHKQQTKPDVAREVLNFFDWAYQQRRQDGRGARLRADAGEASSNWSKQSWKQINGPDGKPVWTGHSS